VDDRRAENHALSERGGICQKCGMTWNDYWDADSPQRGQICRGKKPEPQERMTIED
jgi:hypothetical protein